MLNRPLSPPANLAIASVAPATEGVGWVEVLVDCPGAQDLYTYRVPDALAVRPGDILLVPFGAQQIGAIAIQTLTTLPSGLDPQSIRAVIDLVHPRFFPPQYWQLLQRVADYYQTPLMQVLRVALPPGLLGRSQRRIRLRPDAIPPQAGMLVSEPAQRLLQRLHAQKQGDYTWLYLQRQVPGAQRGLQELQQRGWVESYLESPQPVRPKQRQAVILTQAGATEPPTPRQQEILATLQRHGGELWLSDLLQQCRTTSSTVQSLKHKGWLTVQEREVLRLEAEGVARDQPKALTAAQTQAVNAIAALRGDCQVLLHGVTGSGKTEVYLQAIAPRLAQGQSVLVLVPEIGLTPQLTDRFRARFGDRVRVYHSALSDGERYDTWRYLLQGEAQVLIGTRSAIFAPVAHLGLIILDEEHDSSFKQDQPAPCYHARTIAQWRAELANCPLILGSATPALETWAAIHPQSPLRPHPPAESAVLVTGSTEPSSPDVAPRTLYLTLPERIQARPLPPITVVDMREELHQGNRSVFSRSLQQAILTMVEQQQQGILFVPRRGHSTFVSCRSCGAAMNCPQCDISLTYHQAQDGSLGPLRCHYCGYGRSHPKQCPACGSPYLKHFGSGTQRVVQELQRLFPEVRCIRFDSDTTRTKGAHRALITRFAQGEANLLVGTQMLTKGLDLPQVTLVGIVAADGLLHLPDYRASERTFQVLTQVAGRAGRGHDPGQVILQTYTPDDPVIQAVQRYDYDAFVAAELEHRASLTYPPHGRMILFQVSGTQADTVKATTERMAQFLETTPLTAQYTLLGPSPAVIARIAGRHRWHIVLKADRDTPLHDLDIQAVRSLCPASVSLRIDVDPLNLL